MNEFKVGDTVIANTGKSVGNENIGTGYIGTVTREEDENYYGKTIQVDGYSVFAEAFSLYDPLKAAKDLLEKEGYTVTAPPPKRSGTVVVAHHSSLGVFSIIKQSWEDVYSLYPDFYTKLAEVDWTEE